MAQVYRPSPGPRRNAKQAVRREVRVNALDHQGRGVVRDARGVRFVSGALNNEVIDFQPQGKLQGELVQVRIPAVERVTAPCPYYRDCGGCDLQHLELAAQRSA